MSYLPSSPFKQSLKRVERRTVQGFFWRLPSCGMATAWVRGRRARMRARGPRSQEPLEAGRAILVRGLGSYLIPAVGLAESTKSP